MDKKFKDRATELGKKTVLIECIGEDGDISEA